MKKIQEEQQIRENLLSGESTKSHKTLSKIDEENYIKAMNQKAKQDMQQKEDCKKKKEEATVNTKSMLDQQIMQKIHNIEKDKRDDNMYAEKIRQSLVESDNVNRLRSEDHKRRMLEYNRMLQSQMQEQTKLRKFKNVMTEYEKQVNNKEIEEYINNGDHSYSKLPGNTYNVKKLNVSPQFNKPHQDTPEKATNKTTIIETENQNYLNPEMVEIAKKQYNLFTAQNKSREIKKYEPNEKLLKLVEANMNDPLIAQKRNPTYNKEYGYFNKFKYNTH